MDHLYAFLYTDCHSDAYTGKQNIKLTGCCVRHFAKRSKWCVGVQSQLPRPGNKPVRVVGACELASPDNVPTVEEHLGRDVLSMIAYFIAKIHWNWEG